MRTIQLALISVVAAPFFLGCGTLINVAGGGDRTPYGGTQLDTAACTGGLAIAAGISRPDPKLDRATCLGLGFWGLMDLPFSLAADTLTLPLTLPAWLEEAHKEKGPEEQRPSQQ